MTSAPGGEPRRGALMRRVGVPAEGRCLSAAARLSRLNWRFLLPARSPEKWDRIVVLGIDADLVQLLDATDVAAEVSTRASPDDPAGCVVALNASRRDLQHAAPAVSDDGVLLMEVDRLRLRNLWLTPRRLTVQARRLGFRTSGVWLAAPATYDTRRYVPLDSSEALRWYLGTLFIPGTVSVAVMASVTRLMARRANKQRPSAFAPAYYALFEKVSASDRGPSPIAAVGSVDFGLSIRSPATSYLLVTSGQDSASRIVILPFQPGNDEPVAVIKVATDPAVNEDTEAEYHRLGELHASLPEQLSGTVPRPIGLGRFGELVVTAQTSALGQVLERTSGRQLASSRRKIRDLNAASQWIAKFHNATRRSSAVWDKAIAGKVLFDPLADLLDRWGHVVDVDRVLSAAQLCCERTYGVEIPLVGQHFDYAPCNIFVDGTSVTVLDWELSESRRHHDIGLPLRDLLLFVSYWYFLVRRASGISEEVRWLSDLFAVDPPTHRYRVAANDAIRRYCADVDVDHSFVPVALMSLWVERALYQERRLTLIGMDATSTLTPVETCVRYLGAMS